MDLELQDRVIVITGGAKGIGAALSRGVCQENGIAVVVDRDKAHGEKLVAELRGLKASCCFVQAELTTADACRQAIEETVREFGRLDALVNNAGVNDRIGLEDGSPSEYLASLERNLVHYYSMAHFALPHLKRSRGAVVNIASKTAVTGQGGTSGYASAKGAILALTREWAVELLPYGIRINAVVPAEVMTPLYEQWLSSFPEPQKKLKTILSKIPLGNRMTKPEEIAAAVLFLLSSQAAGHVTGQHLYVDGGYVHLDRALT
ncbi:MAG: SDR family oxidoreductase [Acidobacteria bacterium]|nr:SDR family oxidoreductase [Acidobacteriota bacterium]